MCTYHNGPATRTLRAPTPRLEHTRPLHERVDGGLVDDAVRVGDARSGPRLLARAQTQELVHDEVDLERVLHAARGGDANAEDRGPDAAGADVGAVLDRRRRKREGGAVDREVLHVLGNRSGAEAALVPLHVANGGPDALVDVEPRGGIGVAGSAEGRDDRGVGGGVDGLIPKRLGLEAQVVDPRAGLAHRAIGTLEEKALDGLADDVGALVDDRGNRLDAIRRGNADVACVALLGGDADFGVALGNRRVRLRDIADLVLGPLEDGPDEALVGRRVAGSDDLRESLGGDLPGQKRYDQAAKHGPDDVVEGVDKLDELIVVLDSRNAVAALAAGRTGLDGGAGKGEIPLEVDRVLGKAGENGVEVDDHGRRDHALAKTVDVRDGLVLGEARRGEADADPVGGRLHVVAVHHGNGVVHQSAVLVEHAPGETVDVGLDVAPEDRDGLGRGAGMRARDDTPIAQKVEEVAELHELVGEADLLLRVGALRRRRGGRRDGHGHGQSGAIRAKLLDARIDVQAQHGLVHRGILVGRCHCGALARASRRHGGRTALLGVDFAHTVLRVMIG